MKQTMHRAGSRVEWVGLLVLTSFATGCSSPPVQEPLDMPFHVAVVPCSIAVQAASEDQPGAESPAEGMRIALTSEELTRQLARDLERSSFTLVSVLAPPGEQDGESIQAMNLPEDWSTWSDAQLGRWYVRQAEDRGADILAVVDASFDPNVTTKWVARKWWNHLFFLLGGPFCYWVDDRAYVSDVTLTTRFYDLGTIAGEKLRLGDKRADYLAGVGEEFQIEYRGTSLQFTERAGKDAGRYFLSLLIPATWLAKETSSAREAVESDAVVQLSEALARQVRGRATELLEPDLFNFRVEPHGLVAQRLGEGRGLLQGRIHFRQDAEVESLGRCEVIAGRSKVELALSAPVEAADQAGTYVYRVEGEFALPQGVDYVRVAIFHGGFDARSRTFTVPVEAAAAAGAVAAGGL